MQSLNEYKVSMVNNLADTSSCPQGNGGPVGQTPPWRGTECPHSRPRWPCPPTFAAG